jgi:hypothetical protein
VCVGGISACLRGHDRSCLISRTGRKTNAFPKEKPLQHTYRAQTDCRVDKPFSKASYISRINGEAAVVFRDLPLGLHLLVGFVAGVFWWLEFVLFDRGGRLRGSLIVVRGFILALSNGFALIGRGPFGWIPGIGTN